MGNNSSRLNLPGVLPARLREVDLKLSAERESVIDAEEIAAYLEADGLGDELLSDRYGVTGLFDAAEMLYQQKGTGRALDKLRNTVKPVFPARLILRGPLYLLPGISGLLIAQQLGEGGLLGFAFAAAFGWGWTMTIAGVRYAEPFSVAGQALRFTLWISIVVGLLGGALTTLIFAGPNPALMDTALMNTALINIAMGALVGGVMSAATSSAGILLSLGQSGQYAGAFSSPLLAAGIAMMLPSQAATLVALGILGVVPVVTAFNITRPKGSLAPNLKTLRPHLPHALYGWSVALTFVILTAQLGAWTLMPIVLSAGLLEAGVWHAQEWLQYSAKNKRNLNELIRAGTPWLSFSAFVYAAILAVLVGLLQLGSLAQVMHFSSDALIAIPLFGLTLFLSAWLANQRQTTLLTVLWLLVAALTLGGFPHWAVAAGLSLILLALSLYTLTDPRSYR